MKKKHQEPMEQLNTSVPPVEAPEVEEVYNLEDIMREFGGWTTQEEPETPSEPPLVISKEPDPVPEEPPAEPSAEAEPSLQAEPEPREPEVHTREEAPRRKFQIVDLTGDTISFSPVSAEQEQEEEDPAPQGPPVEMPEEPKSQRTDKEERRARKRSAQRLRKQEAQRRKAQRQAVRAARRETPELVYPSAEDACAAYAKVGTLRLRLMFCAIFTAVSGILLLLSAMPLGGLDLTGSARPLSVAMMAMVLAQSLFSYEIFVRGIYQTLTLRFDLMSLLTVAAVVVLADGFFAIPRGRIPLCAPLSLLELLALWSLVLDKKAKWRTLKTVLSMDNPVAAVKEEKAWHGLDCIFRQEGSLEDFTAMLETPDAAQKVMRVYAPIAGCLTALLAGFGAYASGVSFLWAWAALLMAAIPGGGFLACCHPFSILARRLHHAGAAICGWRGAKILSGESGVVIQDQDLFPRTNIAMNGMKMYSDLPVRQVVGYATAVVQAAGSGLLPLFEEVMRNENGRRYTADSFRQYEGGGLGAEIHGDVVLLGSLAFMRLMGVYVPEGTRIQSAAYLSVNKELVGVFALTYAPSAGTKAGLHSMIRSSGLTPILATRDFMITPALVKKRYKVSVDRMEFPVVAERARLSAPDAGEMGKQGALMSKNSFLSFSAAVSGGRLLRKTVHSAVAVALLCGIIGMILLCILTYLGSVNAASAVNLLLYQLIWQLPTLLITSLVGKT